MRNIYFTPGPTELYFTAEEHIKNGLKQGIGSTSHRGPVFKNIYKNCVENLRALMHIPEDYHILITSSANEAWERLIQNCVEKESFHICNGSFSSRFHTTAEQLDRKAHALTAADGTVPALESIAVPENAEMITLCLNESSTGAAYPLEDVYALKAKYPDKLIALDGVSAVPVMDVDFSKIDSLYFSVQKAFGLPAGLGIWIVNNACVEKAKSMEKKGISIGSYHRLPDMVEKAAQYQTAETPNIIGIYTLAKVAEDMLTKGLKMIRNEITYKAAILYQAIASHPQLSAFVEVEKHRSQTVIVAKTDFDSSRLIAYLKEKKIEIGSGYGKYKTQQVRFANFPTHSKEQMEFLVDLLAEFKI